MTARSAFRRRTRTRRRQNNSPEGMHAIPIAGSGERCARGGSWRCVAGAGRRSAGRLGRDLGPGRPQHRLRRHERPDIRPRRLQRPLRQAQPVRGCGERRGVEVDRRRDDLQAGVRQAAGAVDRRDRHRPVTSGEHVGGHRRGLDPQQRFGRRRHLQVHRRRRDLDARRPARFGAHLPDPRRPARGRYRLRLRPGQAVERLAPSAACTRPPTAARAGSWCSRARTCRPAAAM